MNGVSLGGHWENVYAIKGENEVSWFQENPSLSLELMALVGATPGTTVIDVGGGASSLVEFFFGGEGISHGYRARPLRNGLSGRQGSPWKSANQVNGSLLTLQRGSRSRFMTSGTTGRLSISSPTSTTAKRMWRA